MAYTQLLHRRVGGQLRRFLLLRPFGPGVEVDDPQHPPELPPYDAERDLAPRTPQLLQHDLQPQERGTPGRPGLPVVTSELSVGCNLSGACCSQYPVIPTTVEESRRAVETLRRLVPEGAPERAEDAFAPANPGRFDVLSPILSGDGCPFLANGACKVHKAGGADAKPWTCRQFPLQVIHCGDHFEVSILPQCACAARTVTRGSGGDWPRDPLQGLSSVPEVPTQVVVEGRRTLSRPLYLQWARALADRLAAPGLGEPALVLDSAAQSLRISPGALTPEWLGELRTRMLSEAERLEGYLDPGGPQPRGARWVAAVAEALLRDPDAEPVSAPSDGLVLALALRAHLLLELPALGAALRDLTRIARLAGLAQAVAPAEAVDARFEPLTLLLYLWATTRWPVASEGATRP
jgi:Fe-S-cluster containining protein